REGGDSAASRGAGSSAERPRLAAAGERFDIVIADPPAFAKSRKEAPAALRGYRKLARLAASVTANRGILFLACCSHNVGEAEFAEAVRRGLGDAGRDGRILRIAGADVDHPVHPALPEAAYLKAMASATSIAITPFSRTAVKRSRRAPASTALRARFNNTR